MSRWYRFLYGIGFKPWEQDTEQDDAQIDGILSTVESERQQPFGRALDLGCGTGQWSVLLARRGWDVVGVDVVSKAVDEARLRARTAGVDATFVEGDVTALREAGVGGGFSLLLDVECFNHLNDAQRLAVGREVDAVATTDATLLLLAWARARRGPLPPGADKEDLGVAFPNWRIIDEHPYAGELPRPLRRIDPRWYRLVRA